MKFPEYSLCKDEQEVYDWAKKRNFFGFSIEEAMKEMDKSRHFLENALYGLRKKGLLKNKGFFGDLFEVIPFND